MQTAARPAVLNCSQASLNAYLVTQTETNLARVCAWELVRTARRVAAPLLCAVGCASGIESEAAGNRITKGPRLFESNQERMLMQLGGEEVRNESEAVRWRGYYRAELVDFFDLELSFGPHSMGR